MIDELYAVRVAGNDFDIVDFEDGTHLVIDGRNIYSQRLKRCKQPCLCESHYVCSCGSEDEPNGECFHIRAVRQFYREVGED